MAGDRRTLVIAAVAMVALVAVGAVSNALFARSACTVLEPEVAAAPVTSDLTAVVRAAFADDDDQHDMLIEVVTELAAALGPVLQAVDVSGAHTLVAVPGGLAAVGERTVVVDLEAGAVRATAGFDAQATVLGDGPTLYSLALTNPLTGQVDALLPVDLDLDAGTCVDTALVGSPLAFHLDAARGQLALFRAEEDSDDPVLELRDPVAGRVWGAELSVGAAPPGMLGEWLTGAIHDQVVVVGHRLIDGAPTPALAAFDRATGAPVWEVDHAALPVVAGPQQRTQVVVHAADEQLLVELRAVVEEGQAPLPGSLVGVDPATGAVRWQVPVAAGWELVEAAVADDGRLLVVGSEPPGQVELLRVEGDGTEPLLRVDAAGAAFAVVPGTGALLAAGSSLQVLPEARGAPPPPVELGGFEVRSLIAAGEGTALLLAGPGTGAILVTFGR